MAGAAAVLIGLSALTVAQTRVWHDSVSYWRQVVDVTPQNSIAQCGLAQALLQAGDRETAVEHYRRAVELSPDQVDLHLNIGILLAQLGRFTPAERAIADLLEAKPKHPQGLFLMGRIAEQLGREIDKMRYFRQAVAVGYRPAFLPLAKALISAGQPQEARLPLERLLAVEPANAEARALLGSLPERKR